MVKEKNTTETFTENYQVLLDTVNKLRSSELTDVDNLINYVEKASVAYKNCKSRIQAVKELIEGHKNQIEE